MYKAMKPTLQDIVYKLNEHLRSLPDGVDLLDIKYQITDNNLESALLILKYSRI